MGRLVESRGASLSELTIWVLTLMHLNVFATRGGPDLSYPFSWGRANVPSTQVLSRCTPSELAGFWCESVALGPNAPGCATFFIELTQLRSIYGSGLSGTTFVDI
jgi:hypothetical protein